MKHIASLLSLIILAMVTSHVGAADMKYGHFSVSRYAAAEAWADSVINTLDLRQQVAQLVFPRLDIKNDEAGRRQLASLVKNQGIGGFLLGKGTLADYKGLIDYAQSLTHVPLMVTLDGEWGLAMRVTDAPRFPHNMALGAVTDTKLIEEYGREVARECRAMGIHVNFAPVLDVNSNPANPVIGYRSFGDNPRRVAELGLAYARGLESGGVMSVAKHFPGHGDTSVDSHKALPVLDRSRQQLDETELVPFREYIKAGMSGVMVGHLDVPVLDKSGMPASLSHAVTSDLLKGRLKFGGIVWTDALAMKGAGGKENNCVAALKAGADVLLQPLHPAQDIDAVMAAIKSGKLKADMIRERCHKLLIYKYLFVVAPGAPESGTEGISRIINSPEASAVNTRLSSAVITVLKDDDGVIPWGQLSGSDIAVVSLGAKTENAFSRMCRKYAPCSLYGGADGHLSVAELAKIRRHKKVIVAVFKQNEAVASTLHKLGELPGAMAVCFVNPYKMAKMQRQLSTFSVIIGGFDDTKLINEAAAQVIFGGLAAKGRLPVALKGWMPEGTGISTEKTRLGFSTPIAEGFPPDLAARIDSVTMAALGSGAFPGCQVLVAKNGNIVIDRSFGTLTKGGTSPVTAETLYDIASVSKAAGVVSALMKAYDSGLFKLNDTIGGYIPALKGTPKGRLTFRQLLLHQSGMPSMLSMYKTLIDTASYQGPLFRARRDATYRIKVDKNTYINGNARLRSDLVSDRPSHKFPIQVADNVYVGEATVDTIMKRIYDIELKSPVYRYSDLNFVLLMDALEGMTGKHLNDYVETGVFEPIGAYNTMYTPKEKGVAESRIAPTERDPMLRRQLLRGFVHDELAAFSGGVQGNAGLFSTAEDLAKLAQTWLQGGNYGGVEIFRKPTVALFTRPSSKDGKGALGFDTSPAKCGLGSERTYGHTGFTGTQMKIDPDNGLIFIFLSNRVSPTRDNPAFTRSDIRNKLWAELYK